jgi:hypothetical protein
MTPQVTLETSTVERLKAFAEPLVDTFDTVINRAIDALQAAKAAQPDEDGVTNFNPNTPPDLSFTTVKRIKFNDEYLPSSEAWWNPFMFKLIREAAKNMSVDELSNRLFINHEKGAKTNNGYKELPEAGVSVQGQDANNAWKQTFELLKVLKIPAQIEFIWQKNAKAAYPDKRGKFIVAFD